MFYIKLDKDMNLAPTTMEPIYRGDHMNRKITFLIPTTVGDINMMTATVYLSYIRADGTADIVLLDREDEPYNESYLQYKLPITTTLSRYAGQICTWLQIYSGPPRHPTIAKSGECILQVLGSKNMDEYISDRNLSLIYMMQRHMEDKIEKAENTLSERIDNTDKMVAAKADNIIFNEEDSTIQLVSTVEIKDEDGNLTGEFEQLPLGDPIFVRADTSLGITNMEIDTDGNLVVTYSDESIQNLGRVVGKDGVVYVPHVSERKVLTFTIENKAGMIPDPVDLNPRDEWGDLGNGSVNSSGLSASYEWEGM